MNRFMMEIPLEENQVSVISIENPAAYTCILKEIWKQTQGDEGEVILFDGEKCKNIAKEIECIFNPFSLDCNNKRILTKLYQELKEESDSVLLEEFMTINSQIVKYLDKLIYQVSYPLKCNLELDVVNLLKLYNVEVDAEDSTLLENLVNYLRISSQILKTRIFIFVGLKQYLTQDELDKLYEFAFYEKLHLVIIEAMHSPCIRGEKGWILDKDLCIIEV